MSRIPFRLLLYCLRTGSSAHPGVTRLRPSIPIKPRHPPLPCPSPSDTYSSFPPSPSPLLTDSCHLRSHSYVVISFRVVCSYRSAAVCCHHCSRNLLPPSYPFSFAQTLNIGRRATHSATVTCLMLVYSCTRCQIPLSPYPSKYLVNY